MTDDLRAELSSVAASLRAYLEQQLETGATGIPRAPKGAAPTTVVTPASPAPAARVVPQPAPAGPPPAAVMPSPAPPPPVTAPSPSAAPVAALPVDPATRHTRLPVLAAEVASCTRCVLARTRTQTVFARGNPDAALCFIGEAPGADEDAQGLPFVGRAGQLLDRMIAAMGLSPEKDVYVCNIIKCRPPENRKPTPEETTACIPYLHEQLALIKPKVIVALGNTAAGTLLGTKVGITKIRGEWKLYRGSTLVMPTYHPSYLIRPSAQQADAKRQAWEDLQSVMRELKLPLPKKGTDA